MIIDFNFESIEPFSLPESALTFWLINAIRSEGGCPGEISFIFCNDAYLLEVNRQYLNHDYYTDVITFDYVNNHIISGDIFISVDRVRENAESFGVSFQRELCRVMIHGVLHLLGYDDKDVASRWDMTIREDIHIAHFFVDKKM
jgi:rRNA maturation RNase YbeY